MLPAASDVEDSILRSQLGQDLEAEHLALLSKLAGYRTFSHGQEIVSQGDLETDILILERGEAEIHAICHEPLYRLKPGMIFGEVSLLDGKPRSATVLSVGESSVISIDGAGLTSLLQAQTGLAMLVYRNIARAMCSRVRTANQQLAALLTEEELRDRRV